MTYIAAHRLPGTIWTATARGGVPWFHGAVRADSYRSNLMAGFDNDTTAVLMYDTDTVPVSDAPGSE